MESMLGFGDPLLVQTFESKKVRIFHSDLLDYHSIMDALKGVLVTADLKFVVDAHICVFEDSSAYGRYLCFDRVVNCNQDAVELARMLSPPSSANVATLEEDTSVYQQRITNKKLNKLMVDFDNSLIQLH
ncbi:cinnamoyl-CoA reductase-like SNL6 isoform X2 [Humulus lupulus]|uniref:cinnamoyl-CoA reductase-like SNL6 isoform X2 n=1 Tax=Humulus lupulus TaxID=3486 RepID=UPI002B40CE3B|nr:cinnamoyl-CoA reductase-like SNL6 isoform X2 [Humulus lupulus]